MCINQAGPIGEEIRRTGVPFSVLGLTPGVSRPTDVLRLRDALHTAAPTIVHTFLLTGSLYGRFAAMMSGVPIVIGTEVNIYENKSPRHIAVERWLMAKTDRVVVSAESVRVLDDRSANGTRVNGERVTGAELSDGDVIQVGQVVLTYREFAES